LGRSALARKTCRSRAIDRREIDIQKWRKCWVFALLFPVLAQKSRLTRLVDCARKYGVPLHMHLLETAYQKEYARRRGGCTAVEYIDRFGLLGPQMTLGRGVWLNERDIDRLAETGT
jgi:cytosine/adenosine deaminase-related metal-dependent hydrolase